MAIVKSTDVFIERSLGLLEVNPSTTRISITYGSQSKKIEKKLKGKTTKSPIEDKSFVSIKIFDPISGELHKLKTHKLKDLSKILTALGPHGIQITKTVKKSKSINKVDNDGDENLIDNDDDKKEITKSIPIRGFSSILTNCEIKEEEQEQEVQKSNEVSNNPTNSSTGNSKKKNKKKGKR